MLNRPATVVALQAVLVVACIAGSASAAIEGAYFSGPATIQVTFKQRGQAKQTYTDSGSGYVYFETSGTEFTMGGFGEFPGVTAATKSTRRGRVYVIKNPADPASLNTQSFSVLTASGFYGDVARSRIGGTHRVAKDGTSVKSAFAVSGRGTVPVEGPAIPFTFRIVEKVNGSLVVPKR
ncbi:MAG: hypothetical protein K8T90_02775 [Planctomycetes bacterium]|nr:hypothetical protein [Planctomycetota bacterium]